MPGSLNFEYGLLLLTACPDSDCVSQDGVGQGGGSHIDQGEGDHRGTLRDEETRGCCHKIFYLHQLPLSLNHVATTTGLYCQGVAGTSSRAIKMASKRREDE